MGGKNTAVSGQRTGNDALPSWAGGTAGNFNLDGFKNLVGSDLQSLYGQDPSKGVFNESLYSPMGAGTRSALGGLDAAAMAGRGGLGQAYGTVQNIQSNPLTSGQTGAMRTMGGIQANPLTSLQDRALSDTSRVASNPLTSGQNRDASQVRDVANDYGSMADRLANPGYAEGQYKSLYRQAGGPSLSESVLMDTALGKKFGQDEPGYATLRSNALNDAITGAGAGFSASGRLGSGLANSSIAEGAGNAVASLDYANHQNDIARQERALGTIEGTRGVGFNQQMGALGGYDASQNARIGQRGAALSGEAGARGQAFGMDQTGTNTRLAANGQAFGMGQTGVTNAMNAANSRFGMDQTGTANRMAAAGMAPSLYDATLNPYRTQVETGQMRDEDAQGTLTGRNDLFRRQNDAGLNRIRDIFGLLTGQQQEEQSNPWMDALGLGLQGASLFL